MVLKIHPWRITWRYLLVYIVILAIAFGSCFSIFFKVDENGSISFASFGISQGIFIAIFAGLFIATYLMALFGQKYIVEDKYFIVKRLTREYQYDYSNIVFIDIEKSKRKNMVILFSKKSGLRYLLGDKEGKLLETLIKKCPNTMTIEEFRRAYPQERY